MACAVEGQAPTGPQQPPERRVPGQEQRCPGREHGCGGAAADIAMLGDAVALDGVAVVEGATEDEVTDSWDAAAMACACSALLRCLTV